MMQQNSKYPSIIAIIYSLLLCFRLISLIVTIKVSREHILLFQSEVFDNGAFPTHSFQWNISLWKSLLTGTTKLQKHCWVLNAEIWRGLQWQLLSKTYSILTFILVSKLGLFLKGEERNKTLARWYSKLLSWRHACGKSDNSIPAFLHMC